MLLGDEEKGLAIVSSDVMEKNIQNIMNIIRNGSSAKEEEGNDSNT